MMKKQLATPSDLSQKGREAIAKSLNPLVADAFALYLKTKSFHWHLYGPHFRDYHLLFDEQAAQILATLDILAERVRKLGFPTISTLKEVTRLTKVKDEEEFLDAQGMIKSLLRDNQECAKRLRAAHDVCERYHDVATASILEIFLDETERRIWFLFETNS